MKQDTNTKIAEISAPGKIILCGQHAVVYGEDALAMAISLRLKAILSVYSGNTPSSIEFQGSVNCTIDPSDIPSIFPQDFASFKADRPALSEQQVKIHFKLSIIVQQAKMQSILTQAYLVEFQSQLPIGKCLGSSAAFNTVLTAVTLLIFSKNKEINLDEVNRISKILEKVEHGNPSGVDNYLSTYGGVVLYNNRKIPPFLSISDEKIVSKLTSGLILYLVDSDVEKNTKKAVAIVRENWEKDDKYKFMIEQIGGFAKKILNLLGDDVENDWQSKTLEILALNHSLLRELGVSIPKIEQIVENMTIPGERSAKITGAGMGGYVLVAQTSLGLKVESQKALLTKMQPQGLKIKYF